MLYLDNAATSWPKPERVYQTADRALREWSGNPGRAGHKLSTAAGCRVEETRALLARLFGAPDPAAFAFCLNATDALNLALKGLLSPGDRVLVSALEHNSVLRPLHAIGARVSIVNTSARSGIDLDALETALKRGAKLAVLNHVSNVTGAENPIAEAGRLCRRYGTLLLVDAAQSAGAVPINVTEMHIDLLAFPGHKSLLGPQGTGGLYVRQGLGLRPLREGGTGSRSEELSQPAEAPGRYESGTLNTAGLAALGEGLRVILEEGVEAIAEREAALTCALLDALAGLEGLRVYGPGAGPARRPVVSINVDGMPPSDAAAILDSSFDIAARAGLHCAPLAHKLLGTAAGGGTLRLSPGFFTTQDDVCRAAEALKELRNG
ncbi:MAG: aminotransferase class V-fold PLP-dependent enzyme [Treponema sp.]|jgi:cysteine desulfurase family protein|nr:aminotransferase class V-fold PLP-dependent enzyme [Treponema sp.]